MNNKQGEDIMSVLLAHEKKAGTNASNAVKTVLPQESSDSSDNEDTNDMQIVDTGKKLLKILFYKRKFQILRTTHLKTSLLKSF